jgi:hypothetical protein
MTTTIDEDARVVTIDDLDDEAAVLKRIALDHSNIERASTATTPRPK